jgi:methylated-DNA-protein-cysteine methyltransferase-like protein
MSFRDRVLAVVESIPSGRVLSYGAVAAWAGSPRAARAVGSVLRAHGGSVPWWRVVQASGGVAPARPHNAAHVQRALLEAEDVEFEGTHIDLDRFGWYPGAQHSPPGYL